MQLVLFARSAHGSGARLVEAAQRVGARVKLDVDPVYLVLRRPLDRDFEPEPTPDVDPDPIT